MLAPDSRSSRGLVSSFARAVSSLVVRDKGNLENVSSLQKGEGAMFFSQNGKLVLVRCLVQPKTADAK